MSDVPKETPAGVDEIEILDRLFGWDLQHIPQWAERCARGRAIRHGEARDDDELQQSR